MSRSTVQYQGRDYEVVDYELYELPGVPVRAREPKPKNLRSGKYLACLGAAETFDTLCRTPWPIQSMDIFGSNTIAQTARTTF